MDMQLPENARYLITAPEFAYDTRRGVLCAGSRVSRAIHPLADVEAMKTHLIEEGAVAKSSNKKRAKYYCTRDIRTGLLMAYNLYSGRLEQELPECEVAFAEDSDEMISSNEAVQLWSMYASDSLFRAKIERDGYRIIKLIEAEYDWTFVNGKGDGSLSKVEQFVVDALFAAGEIDEFRRGDPEYRECDIVVEKQGRQIEFVSLFDEKVPPRVRYRNEFNEEQALLMEYCDFGYNIVAQGVINKFTHKNYTDKYRKELAIYIVGSSIEAADKVQALEQMLEARIDQIRNTYEKIHIILHDPLETETFAYCSHDRIETYPDRLCSTNIVTRRAVPKGQDPDAEYDFDPERSYLIIKQSIFDPERKSMHWVKGDIAKELL